MRTEEELAYWREKGADLDKIRCDGCRSDRSGHHWSSDCRILACCVYEKRLSYCSECDEFPCETLSKWGAEWEHHAKALERLREMKAQGTEAWLATHGYE